MSYITSLGSSLNRAEQKAISDVHVLGEAQIPGAKLHQGSLYAVCPNADTQYMLAQLPVEQRVTSIARGLLLFIESRIERNGKEWDLLARMAFRYCVLNIGV